MQENSNSSDNAFREAMEITSHLKARERDLRKYENLFAELETLIDEHERITDLATDGKMSLLEASQTDRRQLQTEALEMEGVPRDDATREVMEVEVSKANERDGLIRDLQEKKGLSVEDAERTVGAIERAEEREQKIKLRAAEKGESLALAAQVIDRRDGLTEATERMIDRYLEKGRFVTDDKQLIRPGPTPEKLHRLASLTAPDGPSPLGDDDKELIRSALGDVHPVTYAAGLDKEAATVDTIVHEEGVSLGQKIDEILDRQRKAESVAAQRRLKSGALPQLRQLAEPPSLLERKAEIDGRKNGRGPKTSAPASRDAGDGTPSLQETPTAADEMEIAQAPVSRASSPEPSVGRTVESEPTRADPSRTLDPRPDDRGRGERGI